LGAGMDTVSPAGSEECKGFTLAYRRTPFNSLEAVFLEAVSAILLQNFTTGDRR